MPPGTLAIAVNHPGGINPSPTKSTQTLLRQGFFQFLVDFLGITLYNVYYK